VHWQAVLPMLGPVVFDIRVQLTQVLLALMIILSVVLQTVQVLAIALNMKPAVGQ
jgi:hypothetical protein